MSSFACLRIELPDAWAQKFDTIRVQLVKIVEVYLEGRWSWPRRFSRLTDLIFLLEDPRVEMMDAAELCKLADQLQNHLFGEGAREPDKRGEISLLLYEGPGQAVVAFAAFHIDQVVAAIADPKLLPPGGRLTRIRPGRPPVVTGVAPEAAPSRAPATTEAGEAEEYRTGLIGTYLLSREIFTADLLAVAPVDAPFYFTTVEGEGALPPEETEFDETCFRDVGRVLSERAGGLPLGVPIAYSHFLRGGQPNRLRDMLALLPKDRRNDLNASVYGVPRQLPAGVAHLHPVLGPYFCTINLVMADPGFAIEQIAPHSVGAVVFCVRDTAPAARLAAIRAFAARQDAYRQRGVRQVLANVRTRAELELAQRLDLQLVSGPAVCGFLDKPIGGRMVPIAKLPVNAA